MKVRPQLVLWLSLATALVALNAFSIYRYASDAPNLLSLSDPVVRLYVITPTYPRLTQIAELTRLGQTLKNVADLLWLVCDEARVESLAVRELLDKLGVPYEYYLTPLPDEYSHVEGKKPRGVANRNRALKRILELDPDVDAVFYFADDDNTYDLDLFHEIRKTRRVSAFPVGLIHEYQVSSPVVESGKVVGFYDFFDGGREFQVDMAGFAVNVGHYRLMTAASPYSAILMPFALYDQENGFLRQLLPGGREELEPLADNCTRILAWHTQTLKRRVYKPERAKMDEHPNSNLGQLDAYLRGVMNGVE